jgi:general secretion pathway protein D
MRTRKSFQTIAAALLVSGMGLALAQSPPGKSDLYRLNFENVEIVTLAEAVATASGKQIVLHPQVHGLVSLMSERSMSAAQLYAAFAQTLAMKGYVVEERHNVVKIYPGRVQD